MSTLYDLLLLLDAAAPTDRRQEILGQVKSAIAAGGTLESEHDWGPRRLAYQIEHRPEADFHLLQFSGPPELLESLRRSLRLTDGIVRFRIIKAPGPAPVAARAPEPREQPESSREADSESESGEAPEAAQPASTG